MNARQKAKYYKRKYEELANMPLPKFKVENVPVDTLRSVREVPDVDIYGFDNIKQYIKNCMVRELTDHIDKYIIWTTYHLEHRGSCRFEAELSVVRRQG